MKTSIRIFIFSILFICNAHAASEIWETEINPPAMPVDGSITRWMGGGSFSLWFKLELDKHADGTMTGNVDIRSPMVRCYGNAELEYVNIKDGLIKIKSKPIPAPDCGYFYFEGKVVGDQWVGYIPWNRAKNEAIFTKTK